VVNPLIVDTVMAPVLIVSAKSWPKDDSCVNPDVDKKSFVLNPLIDDTVKAMLDRLLIIPVDTNNSKKVDV